MNLTAEQIDEIKAIAEVVRITGKPMFQSNINLPLYQPLADAGLLTIGPHPDFSDDFKAITITPAATMYTRDDRHVGFVVQVMAAQWSTEFSQEDCIAAWKVVRDHLHMPTEPEAR